MGTLKIRVLLVGELIPKCSLSELSIFQVWKFLMVVLEERSLDCQKKMKETSSGDHECPWQIQLSSDWSCCSCFGAVGKWRAVSGVGHVIPFALLHDKVILACSQWIHPHSLRSLRVVWLGTLGGGREQVHLIVLITSCATLAPMTLRSLSA